MQDNYLLQSVTYQLFRLSDLHLLGTYQLDPGPSLSGHIDPEEVRIGPDGSAYIQTLSCGLQRVTGIDGANPKSVLVHQFPGTFCGVPTIAGHYLVQSVESIGGFVVLDITNGAEADRGVAADNPTRLRLALDRVGPTHQSCRGDVRQGR